MPLLMEGRRLRVGMVVRVGDVERYIRQINERPNGDRMLWLGRRCDYEVVAAMQMVEVV